jgi:hypothetical protein
MNVILIRENASISIRDTIDSRFNHNITFAIERRSKQLAKNEQPSTSTTGRWERLTTRKKD